MRLFRSFLGYRRNIYFVVSSIHRSSVFKPSNIQRFCCLGIRRIFTIRPRLELSEDWDQEADEMIDNDAYFIRRRIEIVDHPSVDLLQHLQDIVQELDTIIESREQVHVHWYVFSF